MAIPWEHKAVLVLPFGCQRLCSPLRSRSTGKSCTVCALTIEGAMPPCDVMVLLIVFIRPYNLFESELLR
jgi:hypothetical protein